MSYTENLVYILTSNTLFLIASSKFNSYNVLSSRKVSTGAVAYYIIGPTGATGHQGLAGPTGPAAPFPDGRGIVAPYYFNEGSSIGITHHYTQSTSGYTGLNTIYGERNFNDTSISDHVTILGYGSLPVQQQAVGGTYNIAIGTDSMNGSTNTAGNVSIGNQANYFLNGSSLHRGRTAIRNLLPILKRLSILRLQRWLSRTYRKFAMR